MRIDVVIVNMIKAGALHIATSNRQPLLAFKDNTSCSDAARREWSVGRDVPHVDGGKKAVATNAYCAAATGRVAADVHYRHATVVQTGDGNDIIHHHVIERTSAGIVATNVNHIVGRRGAGICAFYIAENEIGLHSTARSLSNGNAWVSRATVCYDCRVACGTDSSACIRRLDTPMSDRAAGAYR